MSSYKQDQKKGRIIGIGGVFFKSHDPSSLTDWYRKHLGLSSEVPYYEGDDAITIRWKSWQGDHENTVWAPFPNKTDYFEPSTKGCMINFVVENIEMLIEKLVKDGVQIIGEIEKQPFGKFARIVDPEGNKVEFWEPDREYFKDKY